MMSVRLARYLLSNQPSQIAHNRVRRRSRLPLPDLSLVFSQSILWRGFSEDTVDQFQLRAAATGFLYAASAAWPQ